ncbi:hypothetical protein [Streptomyces sp. NBC_01445]|uniref:hypothetical protein n=1 Tax=Streptomyces sp. NBC_01445 TaxID=2903869 RepID=UPI002DDAA6CC|nr:hypothetical protein [Streptomyces sp. NBC_01445]WSE09833.1 hypothetical protein OG574_44645 [Streptomyces sp. NBC_01445]
MPLRDQDSALSRRRFLAAGAACAGALAVPAAVGAPPAAAATHYTLTATNNSTQFQDICLFQKTVGLGIPSAMSLAWLTAPARPGHTVTFTWSVDYSFVWAVTGPLMSGIPFMDRELVAADPDDELENQTGFDFDNGNYGFVPASDSGTPLGGLGIQVLPGVPDDTASVGIGMDGAPVFAAQAVPGAKLVFTPHPQYWITAGTFSNGEVLDVEEITNDVEIPYDDTFSMNAVLGPNNLWTVSA